MKKVILFTFLSTLLYGGSSDIAFTAGYNKFDDPDFLRSGRAFFGIRGGVYQDDGFGAQVGFEYANGANCQGLNLSRFYANGVYMPDSLSSIKPYGVVTIGYEISNIEEHKPSQLFIGGGVGIRKSLSENMDGFIETRVLQKLTSSDTDIITTLGVSLALNKSRYSNGYGYVSKRSDYVKPRQVAKRIKTKEEVEFYDNPPMLNSVREKNYYVQLAAIRKNPSRYLEKYHSRGVYNAEIKEVFRNGIDMFVIVSGPYLSKSEAYRSLHSLKKISRGAFITKI